METHIGQSYLGFCICHQKRGAYMDIIKIFQEAALCLQQEPVYLELKTVKEENDQDEILQKMIEEYRIVRVALNQAVENGEPAVELDAKAMKLYGEIMSCQGIVRYHKAKVEAERLIALLGKIITTAMNGGDPLSVHSEGLNCSGSCASCIGCHPQQTII